MITAPAEYLMWAVFSPSCKRWPQGRLEILTIRPSRTDAIFVLTMGTDPWSWWRRRGYRVARVCISELSR